MIVLKSKELVVMLKMIADGIGEYDINKLCKILLDNELELNISNLVTNKGLIN